MFPDLIPFLKLINPLINGIVYIKSDLSCSCCGSPLKESTFERIYPNKLDNVKRTVYKCSNKDCAKKNEPIWINLSQKGQIIQIILNS